MLRQASRLSIKMTGNPAFRAGRSHQQSQSREIASLVFQRGRNDMLWPPVTKGLLDRVILRFGSGSIACQADRELEPPRVSAAYLKH